jgi:hypothetical protein
MLSETFREKVKKVVQISMPHVCEFMLPFICDGRNNLAIFSVVEGEKEDSVNTTKDGLPELPVNFLRNPSSRKFKETFYILWPGKNGSLRQGEVVRVIGNVKTSPSMRLENGFVEIEIICGESLAGETQWKLFYKIPYNFDTIGLWCDSNRPDKIVFLR